MLDSKNINILKQGLDAVWLKQKIISQNISNSETPGYKAKTVEFKQVLKNKCKYTQYHKGQDNDSELQVVVKEQKGTNQVLDGNNVDVEKEMMDLADAQLQYDALIQKMNKEFTMLRTAISR